ncbi:predicted protein [Naegleria gruberi]|uniref:Predicted protein n=1 Tax=Naegleria gruberi TaxID=5762 RepID=D2VXJ9_NAEGR|nr:uncharacterized protein NAEGRDRAFT_73775 [Naegleria gruberi]EFC38522.1 predicted protein [Naegleria gruberi]|eukprot:XP_002671266.1 predicted protein [Naegleria gruberi strain NEG-M]
MSSLSSYDVFIYQLLDNTTSLVNDTITNSTSTSDIISAQNAGLGVLCAAFGGIFSILFLVPTPVFTKLIHRKTLWRFENSWLISMFFGLVFWPLVGLFCQGLVPISSLEYYFHQSSTNSTYLSQVSDGLDSSRLFLVEDWIGVVVAHVVWVVFGFSMWALSSEYIGFGWSGIMVYGVASFFNIMTYWVAGKDVDYENGANSSIYAYPLQYIFTNSKGIVFCVALPFIVFGVLFLCLGYFFVEKNTREKRMEDETVSRTEGEHMEKTINWTEVVKKETERQKNVSRTLKMRVLFKYYIGLFLGALAGIVFFLFEVAFLAKVTTSSGSLVDKLQRTVDPNNLANTPFDFFRARVFIIGISFPISYPFVFMGCFVLLLYNRTIKKMALCSGGFVCMGGGMNVRVFRILGLIVSIFQGLFWYGSILLLILAEHLYGGRSNFPIIIHAFFAILTSIICGLCFLELRGTKLAEKILIAISYLLIFIAIGLISYSAFPTHSIEGLTNQ